MKLSDFIQEKAYKSFDPFKNPEVSHQLLNQEITASELRSTYSSRLLNDWHQKGLLPPQIVEKKRKRFSPADCIWLGLVSDMKSLGIPSSTIQQARDTMYEPFDPGIIFENQEIIEEMVSRAPENEKEELRAFFMDKSNKEPLKKDFPLSLLDMLLIEMLTNREELNLWINQDGETLVVKPAMIEEFKKVEEFNAFMRKPFFSISISEKLGNFLVQSENNEKYNRVKLLSYNEAIVIREMRDKSNARVSVKRISEDEILLKSTGHQISMTRDEYIHSIVRKGKYSYIVNTDNGKTLNVQRTKQQKL